MATDLERLVVQLSADIKAYQNGMQQAMGVTNRQARAIENRWRQANKNLDNIGRGMARGLIAPLTGIGAALGAREVLQYADAWTKAKNSLAVAGVTGKQQADVLDQLFESAQRNATPIGVLTDLYGKAALSADRLGASQSDLIQFSDGIAVALKASGTSVAAASGALTQLGQALGAGTVRAEEFNSILEGAPAIARAAAAGLPGINGDIGKLRQVMLDGGLASRDFFNAFLKGLPSIQSLAANATQTIEQGITKVSNAFTKYIGQTDESLGASQRLVEGLNALAKNFGATADAALNLAGILAGALLGRSVAGMLRNLGLVGSALISVVTAIRSAMTVAGLATAMGGLGAVAGPVGLIIGGVATALYLFGDSGSEAEDQTRRVNEVLKELGIIAPQAARGIETATDAMDAQSKKVDELRQKLILLKKQQETLERPEDSSRYVYTDGKAIDDVLDRLILVSRTLDEVNEKDQKEAIDELIRLGRQAQEAGSDTEQILKRMGEIKNFNGLEDAVVNGMIPALKSAVEYLGQLREGTAKVAAEVSAAEYAAANPGEADRETRRGYARSPLAAFARTAPLPPTTPDDIAYARNTGTPLRGTEKKTPRVRATADSRFDQDIQAIRDRTAALAAEQEMIGQSVAAQESRRLQLDLEAQALADLREEARRKGETDLESIQLAPEQIAAIKEVSDAYGQQAEALAKAQQAFADANDLARGFADDMVSGLLDGASAAETLANALDNVADKLLDMALNSLFDPNGGVLGGLFKGLTGLATGGPVSGSGGIGHAATGGSIRGPGSGTSDSIPMMLSNGEYVVNAKQAKKYAPLLEAINSGTIGKMAGGGLVAPRLPRTSSLAASRAPGAVTVSMPITIDASGADEAALSRVQQQITRLRHEIPGMVVANVRDAQRRNKGL